MDNNYDLYIFAYGLEGSVFTDSMYHQSTKKGGTKVLIKVIGLLIPECWGFRKINPTNNNNFRLKGFYLSILTLISSSLVTSHLIRHASPGPLSFISFSSFSPSATRKHNTENKVNSD